jgi:AraC-like DNA-binding protein
MKGFLLMSDIKVNPLANYIFGYYLNLAYWKLLPGVKLVHVTDVKMSSSDVCFQVGYASPSQFSREYKRLFEQVPSKYIEQARLAS